MAMIPPLDLVVIGEDWGRHPSSTQHLVRELARSRKVLYVNSLGLRRPRLNAGDLRRAWRKLLDLLIPAAPRRAEQTPPSLTVLAPVALPFPGSRLAGRINHWLLGSRIRHALRRCGISAPALWISMPTGIDAVGTIGERAVIYYCGDDFGALDGVDHAPVLELERRCIDAAQLIFAVSPVLEARLPPARTMLLEHGVDLDLFSRPAPRAGDLPVRPVAGYYGNICERVDQPLLAQVAKSLPDWIFLLIGEIRVPVEKLTAEPNIRFLGPRPHGALPGYSQHWSVSILPFLDTAMVRASNPLKLREYIAAGRPVVTTPMPAASPFADVISIVADPAGFAQAIRAAATASDDPERLRARVAGESWAARAAAAAARIDAL
jgi:glycosyltransferase involved in cell wall biosynthesis